ncbi:uncharacterized protein LOC118738666 isoform X2 [Rhagoletis pomonella]|uniref:uncharacterized protein LOC118738666 isoform X2 n=1 Tax=Rhagoletis pomonella TaxID=28610 RepID=UPI001782C449|nr:uncharacterized protein LOC118738666 isoform X2 [Rhagoletis pomonella]
MCSKEFDVAKFISLARILVGISSGFNQRNRGRDGFVSSLCEIRMGGQDLLESLCKSISRIKEYCQHAEFKNATLEQVKVRAEKLEAYYGRFVDTHEKHLDQDATQASTYDDIAALVESRYFTAQALLAVRIKELTPVTAPILHEQQPFAVQLLTWALR